MKNIIYSILILFILAFGFSSVPLMINAQTETAPELDYSRFVKCDGVPARNIVNGVDQGVKPGEEARQKECDFAALIDTVNKLINWLFIISIPIATVLFAWAGLLYLTGSEKNIGKAKSIFTSVGIGFIIMIVAWLAVYTVVNWLVKPNFGATSLIEQKK